MTRPFYLDGRVDLWLAPSGVVPKNGYALSSCGYRTIAEGLMLPLVRGAWKEARMESSSISTCWGARPRYRKLKPLCLGRATKFGLLSLAILLLTTSLPTAAGAAPSQGDCNGRSSITVNTGGTAVPVGGSTTVTLKVGSDTITGGTLNQMT